jgi:LPS-assembly protein
VAPLPPLADANKVELSSDDAEASDAGDFLLKGKVRIRRGNRTLTGEDARYDAATQSFVVNGTVEYHDPLLSLHADTGTWGAGGAGSFGHADFDMPSRPARGSADTIVLREDGRLQFDHVEYTACPVGHRDWLLRAQRIDIDQHAQQGVGRNVRLQFEGVPIFYLPVVSFPVGDARKSGLLFPNFGESNRNGLELAAPYYLNLAPNYDATLTPGYMSKRGATLYSEFRYLGRASRGEFQSDWVPSDASFHRDRSFLRATERTDFTSRLRFDTNLAYASDSNYFQDFGLGPEGTSVSYLQRIARLTFLDSHWRAIGLVEQFQTIDQAVAAADRPYARVPQLALRGHWNDGNGPGFEVRGEAVNFTRDTGVNGGRFSLEPTASWALRWPAGFVLPTLGWRATHYSLSDAGGRPTSPSLAAPIGTVDAGLEFERVSGARIETLEPRLLYTWIPYRDQSALPLFDTGLPDLNLVQLFRTQRYVGGDRLGDANQLAFGTSTRVLDADSGRQMMTATLGQIYYFAPPRVRLPTETAVVATTSDVVAQFALTAYRHWNVEIGEEWDPHGGRAIRSELHLQYKLAGDKVVNFGYRFQRGLLEQVDGSFAWPIAAAWKLYARHVYSLRDKAAIDSFAGFEYRSCCWRVRLVERRYVSNSTGTRDTALSVQLELNGLSSVGEKAGAFLERSIRGYSAAAAATPSEYRP